MRFGLFILVLFISLTSFATHNRAGYISYVHSGSSYTFTIYMYTNPASYQADQCYQNLLIVGQTNTVVTCTRTNSTLVSSNYIDLTNTAVTSYSSPLAGTCGTAGSIPGQGDMLIYPYTDPNVGPYGGVKVNTYVGTYIITNTGNFVFGLVDPNLDANINNVDIGGGPGASGGIAFALIDTLHIYSGYDNNSPLVTNPPIDNACRGQEFCYNPGFMDAQDSLAYSLIPFVTGDSTKIPVFYNAPSSSNEGMAVDKYGNLCWNIPGTQTLGEYDVDMLVKEYRHDPYGNWFEVGSLIFAIQIYVGDCKAPNITIMSQKFCLIADSTGVNQPITASSNPPVAMNISASGVPISNYDATFPTASGNTSATSILKWNPSCDAVSLMPYYITVKGYDNATPLANASFTTIPVQVVSKPVANLKVKASGTGVQLTWSLPGGCSSTINPIASYLIYRINDCVPFKPGPCQTGVPASSGYTYIGKSTSLGFFDNNKGAGLPPGTSYSYIVIAQYADGSLSIAPNPSNDSTTCITLHLGIPLLTNVSVDTTDTQGGSVFVRWHRPITLPLNFDTVNSNNINKGPYHFVLQRVQNSGSESTVTSGTYTTIYTSPIRQFFGQLSTTADTTYIDTIVNTQINQFAYKVLFYADTSYIGSSVAASSVFASGAGHDKKAVLTWTSSTPWKDTLYYIYQQNITNSGYTLVDSTHLLTDTIKNLTNKHTYCFKIRSVGSYENINIASPLYNFSEKVCVTPIDDSPPCAPKLSIVGDCNASTNKLTWTNPDNACHIDDVAKYYIYYTPREDSTLSIIDSVLQANDTSYTTGSLFSIAGCYIIVAVDSVGNRSPLTNESCTDNCPEYELPNIFSPNGDGINDFYTPVKNRYVRSVDFVLYNRWGEIVYENTNPALGWDGKSKQMKQPVPDGVYFYTCTVYEIHYYGIREIKLKGFVQVIK
jgi:gliding motility-associated-like protein